MDHALSGAGFSGSPLVALLSRLSPDDRPTLSTRPGSLIEGLGQWLGWKEAIPLAAALQASPSQGPQAPSPGKSTPMAEPFQAKLQALTAGLHQQIGDMREFQNDDGSSYVPFRRRYFALQQSMETAVEAQRRRLRAHLAAAPSPALAQLAALDGALATGLAAREQGLLNLLPVLLEKHFHRLRPAVMNEQDGPAKPWLQTFKRDMQDLQRAELELRLQPVRGLLEALSGTCEDQIQ